jgi:hypothetical protein
MVHLVLKFSFQRDALDPEGQTYVMSPEGRYAASCLEAITEWCEEQFGPPEHNKGGRWCGTYMFWFRDESDAFQFMMRWR